MHHHFSNSFNNANHMQINQHSQIKTNLTLQQEPSNIRIPNQSFQHFPKHSW